MKKIVYVFCFIQPLVLKAQLDHFPTYADKPIWGYYSYGGYLDSPEFLLTGFIGDTIIGTESYSKLFALSDTILNESSKGYFFGGIRISGEQVYFYNARSNIEKLIYDFSISVNDTFMLDGLGYGIVEKIDSIIIHGTVHERYYLQDPIQPGDGTWIKYIGAKHGLINSILYQTDNNPPTTNLVCFKYGNINYYPDDNCNCFNDYIQKTNSIKKIGPDKNRLAISQNPVTHESVLRSVSNELISEIIIYDISGSVINVQSINSESFLLGKIPLKPGMYFLCAQMQYGNIYSTKFIKL